MPPPNDPNMIKAIRTLYKSNPIAKALFDDFSKRARSESVHTADRILEIVQQAGVSTRYWAIMRFLKMELAPTGCCRFIIGRRGQDTRVTWSFDIVDLGKSAIGEDVLIEASAKNETSANGKSDDAHVMMAVSFPLRPLDSVDAVIQIPRNLSQSEAQRLADFIKTLPVV
jgi:hypothetical protein